MPHRISDVTGLGGGLTALAAALHLGKAGLHVTCVEPGQEQNKFVGESLDWSAPGLI